LLRLKRAWPRRAYAKLWCVVRASDWLEPYLSDHAYLVADRLFTYEVRLQARPQTQERRLGDAFIRRAAAEDLTALCALDEMCLKGHGTIHRR
jgi:hypothetical protein